MSQIEKLKRWAEKQGWFALYQQEWSITYLLPSGDEVLIVFDTSGTIIDSGICEQWGDE